MNVLQHTLTSGLVYGVAVSALILGSLLWNPRIWVQDLPAELRALVPPKTPAEQRQTQIVAIPMLILMLGGPALAGATGISAGISAEQFFIAFGISYGVNLVFNVFDLVLIDWLIVCTWTPARLVYAPLRPEQLKDYGYHARAFAKGVFLLIVPSMMSAALALLLNLWW